MYAAMPGGGDRKSVLGLHIRSAEGPDPGAGGVPRPQAHPPRHGRDPVSLRLASHSGGHPDHQAGPGKQENSAATMRPRTKRP